MSKKNDDFFVNKKDWSVVKDELLGCYFKPYLSKILHTYKPIIYVDCFAGKGKFEDGNPGSPLIALDIINQCLETTTVNQVPIIETTFIDLYYSEDLRKNLAGYPNVNIISGKYEDYILPLLEGKRSCNVFLYIDPYGIKALRCSYFDSFAKEGYNSIELLINMNSFGFIREACHALGTSFSDQTIFEDLIEYDPTELDNSDKSIRELIEIAGGDYWIPIIESYKKGKISGYDAEDRFANLYCQRLSKSYKYVLNMPLRIKQGQRPKYRLIHATNHRDGCLLMVDNICNRWEALQEIQRGGQVSMWDENYDNQFVDKIDLYTKITDHYSQYSNWSSLNDTLASFFMEHGPICSTSEVKNHLKEMEGKGTLQVLRNPSTTSRGKPSGFMSESKDQTVSVRWNA